MQSTIFDVLLGSPPSSSSGKTSPESSARDEPSTPSWEEWSAAIPPSFSQESATGPTRVWLLDPSAPLPTGSWIPSFSDHLNEGGGFSCSLLDILELGWLPTRFFQSDIACAGILRRAARRGRSMPEALAQALEAVAGDLTNLTDEELAAREAAAGLTEEDWDEGTLFSEA